MAINETGQTGERVAADFLRSKGFEVLDMNFKNNSGRRLGEIDIIAKKDGQLVFVEVKTRNFQNYSGTLPEENITRDKLRKLSKIAHAYLRQHALQDASYRFDAISVWLDIPSRTAKIKHIPSMYL